MRWQDHIHSNPDVLLGKPVVKGTRLAVDFILRLLAEGWSLEQILENYPGLTPESLRAIFAFAAEAIQDESLSDDNLRPEYDFDFTKGERGRYYNRLLQEGLDITVLEPDITETSPDSEA